MYNKVEYNKWYRKTQTGRLSALRTKLKLRYNISIEDYEKLFEKQKGLCAICNSTTTRAHLDIDHDHLTGKVRGLLCRKCNHAIGLFYDAPELLLKAFIYLGGEKEIADIFQNNF